MTPFARFRAWQLIAGAVALTLLLTPLFVRGQRLAPAYLLVIYPLILAWAWVLARRAGVEPRRLAGPRPGGRQAATILALVPGLTLLSFGSTWLIYYPVSLWRPEYVNQWLGRLDRAFPTGGTFPAQAIFVFTAVLVAPVVEETVFRGLLLHRWCLLFGRVRGILLTTLAFALLHPAPVSAFLLGLGFALVYLRTGSLLLTMAAHGLNNFVVLTVLPILGGPGETAGTSLEVFQRQWPEGAAAFLLGALILWAGRRWYLSPADAPLPYDRGGAADPPAGEHYLPGEPGRRDAGEGGAVSATRETATLAGGCFWCLEAAFQQLRGVERVTSGYAGGTVPDPSYQAVCGGGTGHAEVVQIEFDPAEIEYRELLEVFFTIHDPTTLNRQGPDSGTQYRSAIFYHTDEQRAVAEQVIAEFTEAGLWDAPIVTEVRPLETFYPAEAYHQEYFRKNPYQPYCLGVVAPKVAKVRARYAQRLKQASA